MKMIKSIAALVAVPACAAIASVALASDPVDGAHVAYFHKARVSLREAVATAEASAHGRAYDAAGHTTDGAHAFDVAVVVGENVVSVKIDPASGKVLGTADEGPLAAVMDADGDEPLDISKLTMPLEKAIAAAEAGGGGRAIDAEYKTDSEGADAVIEITLALAGGKTRMMKVDPASGAITRVSDAGTAEPAGTMEVKVADDDSGKDGQESGEGNGDEDMDGDGD
ncbi:MAG: hypothetical protein R3D33_14200 [Hyphomicrobiaceae bacterium]